MDGPPTCEGGGHLTQARQRKDQVCTATNGNLPLLHNISRCNTGDHTQWHCSRPSSNYQHARQWRKVCTSWIAPRLTRIQYCLTEPVTWSLESTVTHHALLNSRQWSQQEGMFHARGYVFQTEQWYSKDNSNHHLQRHDSSSSRSKWLTICQNMPCNPDKVFAWKKAIHNHQSWSNQATHLL